MKPVTSRSNPTFKRLKALAADPREQRAQGRTLIEGPHLLSAHLEKRGPPLLVAVSESGAEREESQALLAQCGRIETLRFPEALFRELAGTETPTGLLAEIAIPESRDALVTGSCVLLDAVQDAGNVGAILRTAAAAGIRDVILGPGCAGAWMPKVLRAGQGAHFDLCIRERVDIPTFLSDYPGTGIATVARDGTPVYELDLAGPVAWLFGNEGAGVSASLLASVRRQATIPLVPGCESLNVAAAAAICLFEERRQKLYTAEKTEVRNA